MALVLKTYSDIVSAVREALGVQSSDTIATNKIKRLINMVYLDEVVPAKRWKWLEKETTAMHDAYYAVGTATVTNDSTTVTLNTAPNVSLGSFKGYKFAVDGFAEIYEVSAHTAASASVTLDAQYLGITSSTVNFKIWRDKVNLPANARETVEVWHARMPSSMKGVGPQDFIKYVNTNPKAEGFPSVFNTTDFFDPSTGDDETESDRYRRLEIYPSITLTPVTIKIKYIEEVDALEDDTDEPVIPINDRMVLYYGTLAHAWSIIARDEEMSLKAERQFATKLARMMGNVDEGFDQPKLGASSSYLSSIRSRGISRKRLGQMALAGSSSYSSPTYAKNITIEGANITDDVTVSTGVTIDGYDISELGESVDAFLEGTEVTLTDNTTDQVVATWVVATYDVIHIDYSIKRSTAYEAGQLKIISDGSTAAIADGGIASLGDPGVTFTVDIDGTNLRLLSTTTSTGANASMQYVELKWKA